MKPRDLTQFDAGIETEEERKRREEREQSALVDKAARFTAADMLSTRDDERREKLTAGDMYDGRGMPLKSRAEAESELLSTDRAYGLMLKSKYEKGTLDDDRAGKYLLGVREGFYPPAKGLEKEFGQHERRREGASLNQWGLTNDQANAWIEKWEGNKGLVDRTSTFIEEGANAATFGNIDKISTLTEAAGIDTPDRQETLDALAEQIRANNPQIKMIDARLAAQRFQRAASRERNPNTALGGELAGYATSSGKVTYDLLESGAKFASRKSGLTALKRAIQPVGTTKRAQATRYFMGPITTSASAGFGDGFVFGGTVARSNREAEENRNIKLFSDESFDLAQDNAKLGALFGAAMSPAYRLGRLGVVGTGLDKVAKSRIIDPASDFVAGLKRDFGEFIGDTSGAMNIRPRVRKGKVKPKVDVDPETGAPKARKFGWSDAMTPTSRKQEVALDRMRKFGMSDAEITKVREHISKGDTTAAEAIVRTNYNRALIMIEKRLQAEGIPIEALENKMRQLADEGDSLDEFFFEVAKLAGSGKNEALAKALAIVPGKSRTIARDNFVSRAERGAGRLEKALNDATGIDGADYYGNFDALDARGKEATDAAYKLAEERGALTEATWGKLFEADADGMSLMQRPSIRKALPNAVELANDAGEYGAARELQRMLDVMAEGDLPPRLSVKAFKYIDQELTSIRKKANEPGSSTNPRGVAMAQDELRRLTDPETLLAKARDVNTKFETAKEAFEDARGMFRNGTDLETIEREWAGRIARLDQTGDPEIQRAILHGMIRGAKDALETSGNMGTALRKLYGTDRAKTKLKKMLMDAYELERKSSGRGGLKPEQWEAIKRGDAKHPQDDIKALLGGDRIVKDIHDFDTGTNKIQRMTVPGRLKREAGMHQSMQETIRNSNTADKLAAIDDVNSFEQFADEMIDNVTAGPAAWINRGSKFVTRRATRSGIYEPQLNEELGTIMFKGGREHLDTTINDLRRIRDARRNGGNTAADEAPKRRTGSVKPDGEAGYVSPAAIAPMAGGSGGYAVGYTTASDLDGDGTISRSERLKNATAMGAMGFMAGAMATRGGRRAIGRAGKMLGNDIGAIGEDISGAGQPSVYDLRAASKLDLGQLADENGVYSSAQEAILKVGDKFAGKRWSGKTELTFDEWRDFFRSQNIKEGSDAWNEIEEVFRGPLAVSEDGKVSREVLESALVGKGPRYQREVLDGEGSYDPFEDDTSIDQAWDQAYSELINETQGQLDSDWERFGKPEYMQSRLEEMLDDPDVVSHVDVDGQRLSDRIEARMAQAGLTHGGQVAVDDVFDVFGQYNGRAIMSELDGDAEAFYDEFIKDKARRHLDHAMGSADEPWDYDPNLLSEDDFYIRRDEILGEMTGGNEGGPRYSEVAPSDANMSDYEEVLFRLNDGTHGSNWTSGHWNDKPGLFAWYRRARMNVRGNDVPLVMEMQSDMHQSGRRHGYADHSPEANSRLQELAQRKSDATQAKIAADDQLQADIAAQLPEDLSEGATRIVFGNRVYEIENIPPGSVATDDIYRSFSRLAIDAQRSGLPIENFQPHVGKLVVRDADGKTSLLSYSSDTWMNDVNSVVGEPRASGEGLSRDQIRAFDAVMTTAVNSKAKAIDDLRIRIRNDFVQELPETQAWRDASNEHDAALKARSGPDSRSGFQDDQWVTVAAGDAIRSAIERGETSIAFPANGAMIKSVEGSSSSAPFYRSSVKRVLDKLAKQMGVGKPKFETIDEGIERTFKAADLVQDGGTVPFFESARSAYHELGSDGVLFATPEGVFRYAPDGDEALVPQIAEDVIAVNETANGTGGVTATIRLDAKEAQKLAFQHLDKGHGPRGVWMIDIPESAVDKFRYAALLVSGGAGLGTVEATREEFEATSTLSPRPGIKSPEVQEPGDIGSVRTVHTPPRPRPVRRARPVVVGGVETSPVISVISPRATRIINGVDEDDANMIVPRRRNRARIHG